jgi:hypothetical protein
LVLDLRSMFPSLRRTSPFTIIIKNKGLKSLPLGNFWSVLWHRLDLFPLYTSNPHHQR